MTPSARDWTKVAGLAALSVSSLFLAWWIFGILSLLFLVVGLVGLAILPVAALLAWFRQGRLKGRGGNVRIAVAAVLETLLVVLVTLALLPGSFHRPTSHRDGNLVKDPYFGHLPVPLAEYEERGVPLDQTIGQRFEVIDMTREQVVIHGDSVLHGWGVAPEESAAAILKERIVNAQVVNASVSGYSIDQYYMYLKAFLPRTRPKVVVIGIYAGNDYQSAGMSNWRGHSKPLFVRDGDGIKLFRERAPSYNCVDQLGGSLLFKPIWTYEAVAQKSIDVVCNVRTLSEPEHAFVVEKLLEAIDETVKKAGGRALFVLLPDRNDFNMDRFVVSPDQYYAKTLARYDQLATLLKEGGFDVLWFKDEMERASENPFSLYLPNDSAHLNVAGNRLLADVLQRELKERYGIW